MPPLGMFQPILGIAFTYMCTSDGVLFTFMYTILVGADALGLTTQRVQSEG